MVESDDEDFGVNSSQSMSKPTDRKAKEPNLFDKYKSGGAKAAEIIGKKLLFCPQNPTDFTNASSMHRCRCFEPQLDPRRNQVDK